MIISENKFYCSYREEMVAEGGQGDEEEIAEASRMQMMENQESTADADIDIDMLKRQKTKAKLQFTRAKCHLLNLLDSDITSRGELSKPRKRLIDLQEPLINCLLSLSAEYKKANDILKKLSKAEQETEMIEDNFKNCQDRVQDYLDARRDDPPSVSTDSLHGSEYFVNEEKIRIKKKANSFREEVPKFIKKKRKENSRKS